MNILSLFDGMSCGQIAANRAGLPITGYYASEIDKHAIKVTMANYPNTVQLGSVTDLLYIDWLNPKIDMLIGGSPCQNFSFAGKRKGMVTKDNIEILTLDQYLTLKDEGFKFEGQSYLFWEYVRILKEIQAVNPDVLFLLENVKMTRKWQDLISSVLGVEPILINSALVSAQNRQRLYWTNIQGVTQPDDKGLVLADILEDGVSEKFNLSNDAINYMSRLRNGRPRWEYHKNPTNGKAACLTANMYKGVPYGVLKLRPCERIKEGNTGHIANATDITIKRVYGLEGKGPCLTTMGCGHREPKILCIEKLKDESGKYFWRVPEATKKGYTDVYPGEFVDLTFLTSKTRRGRKMTDKSNCLTATNFDYCQATDSYFRKLTPTECERLQTVPDNEIICIFALCLDQVKNYVNAVEQNPKLLKLALSAEKEELNEFVKLANQNTKQNNQLTKSIVQQGVDMMTQRQINQCTKINQKENNTTVNNAENIVMCKSQNQEEDFVLPNVFINIIEGRIMRVGMEELHQKGNHSTIHLNGKKPLVLSGNEIMQLVKDVDAGMKKTNDLSSTSTILSVLSTNSLEQMLATYYWFAKSAITGFTQDITNQNSLSVQFQINDGYTSIVSNTQRYRMLGNGWTVSVVSHIFSFINKM